MGVYQEVGSDQFCFYPNYMRGTDSRSWCTLLLRQARSALLIELKQIAEVDNVAYIRELIDEIDPPKPVREPAKDAAVEERLLGG